MKSLFKLYKLLFSRSFHSKHVDFPFPDGWDEDIMLLMKVYAGWDEDTMSIMNVYDDWAGNCVVYGFSVS